MIAKAVNKEDNSRFIMKHGLAGKNFPQT